MHSESDRENGTNEQHDERGLKLTLKKIGVVSRHYGKKYSNGYRDFSHVLSDVLALLDNHGCDAAAFSLYSVIVRDSFDLCGMLDRVAPKGIKAIFLEEYSEDHRSSERPRKPEHFDVLYRSNGRWRLHKLYQRFGSLSDLRKEKGTSLKTKLDLFVSDEIPKRIMGNCCVVLCGETNAIIVEGHEHPKDRYGLRAAIPRNAIILNPIHDRMTRPEMIKKRQFLSEEGRWVISVWNKGRKDKNGKERDGTKPAWTVFHDGNVKQLENVANAFGVEIGIVDALTS
jgi:hypothetical protein